MNKVVIGILALVLTLNSCDFTYQVGEQLSFMLKLSAEFGGEWSGSADGDSYTVKVTNSKRLNDNRDSIDYYAVQIGRELLNSLGPKFSLLILQRVEETKVFIFSSFNATTFNFDLKLINRFKKKSIAEYVLIRKAVNAFYSANDNNIAAADEWLAQIDADDETNPFVILARAAINRANGMELLAEEKINTLIEEYSTDDLLCQYLGLYFFVQENRERALKFFKIAERLDERSVPNLLNIAVTYYQLGHFDSSAMTYSRVIGLDSSNLDALYSRAHCYFNMNQESEGCNDIRMALKLEPNLQIADSVITKCNLEEQ